MANATDHLWMHFTRMSSYRDNDIPTIVRGEGCYVWDSHGVVTHPRRLFWSRRPRRTEIARRRQAGRELAFFPRVVRPPDRVELAGRSPSGTRRLPGFFTTRRVRGVGRLEARRAYFKRTGNPQHQGRQPILAYHGT